MRREEALERFYNELLKIHEVKKCRTCECFHETLDDLNDALKSIDERKLNHIRDDLTKWRKETRLHSCLGCDPCLPVDPWNEFQKMIHAVETDV